MERTGIIRWLVTGDVSIRHQVKRDLLHIPVTALKSDQEKIATQGWGARILRQRKANGHWGISFYQPKWTCTHYTLLDLKNLDLPPSNELAQQSTQMMLLEPAGRNGGINCFKSIDISDVCVNGMILAYGSYFLPHHPRLRDVVDFLLETQMADGGWNCLYLERGTRHSSLHSTISVLEGLLQFRHAASGYRTGKFSMLKGKLLNFCLSMNYSNRIKPARR